MFLPEEQGSFGAGADRVHLQSKWGCIGWQRFLMPGTVSSPPPCSYTQVTLILRAGVPGRFGYIFTNCGSTLTHGYSPRRDPMNLTLGGHFLLSPSSSRWLSTPTQAAVSAAVGGGGFFVLPLLHNMLSRCCHSPCDLSGKLFFHMTHKIFSLSDVKKIAQGHRVSKLERLGMQVGQQDLNVPAPATPAVS